MATWKATAPTTPVRYWTGWRRQTSLCRPIRCGSPEWFPTPKPPSNAGSRTMPGPVGPALSWRSVVHIGGVCRRSVSHFLGGLAPFSAASTKRTSISPNRRHRVSGWTPRSSPPGRTSPGEDAGERQAPGDAEKASDLLVRAHTAATAQGTGPWRAAPPPLCNSWTDNKHDPVRGRSHLVAVVASVKLLVRRWGVCC